MDSFTIALAVIALALLIVTIIVSVCLQGVSVGYLSGDGFQSGHSGYDAPEPIFMPDGYGSGQIHNFGPMPIVYRPIRAGRELRTQSHIHPRPLVV